MRQRDAGSGDAGVAIILLIVLLSALYENKYPKLILPLALASYRDDRWLVRADPRGVPARRELACRSCCSYSRDGLQQGALFGKYRLTVLAFTALFLFTDSCRSASTCSTSRSLTCHCPGASLFLVATALEDTITVCSQTRLLIESAG